MHINNFISCLKYTEFLRLLITFKLPLFFLLYHNIASVILKLLFVQAHVAIPKILGKFILFKASGCIYICCCSCFISLITLFFVKFAGTLVLSQTLGVVIYVFPIHNFVFYSYQYTVLWHF